MSSSRPKKKSARPPRRPGFGKTDWLEVERLYVQGEFRPGPSGGPPALHHLSYRELAERFGIRTATVAERGRINDWLGKRGQFSQRVRDEADQKVIQTVSSEVARYTERTMRVGEGLLEIVQHHVDVELGRIARIRARAGAEGVSDVSASSAVSPRTGDTPGVAGTDDDDEKGLSSQQLKNLAEVHAKLVETRRRELGLDELLAARGRGVEGVVREVNEFSLEVARAVIAARAERNRTPQGPQGAAGEGE